ncbi:MULTISPECIES: ATP-dependent DNA ligase [unclassified Streptomyces]|uniref:ATP-dependent DNA ligase n=1 Tax=unclassified Streptomyces TaxID=2593676 RepID=UPI00403C0DC3
MGIEGVVLKDPGQPYLPGRRTWIKVRAQVTSEAVIGAVTGSLTSPDTLLLGRYDEAGRLRLAARTTPLTTTGRRDLGRRLTSAVSEHPWHGRHFSAGWATGGDLEHLAVRPELVAEFVADTAVDAGRHRHPVRFLRVREDLTVEQVPPFGS